MKNQSKVRYRTFQQSRGRQVPVVHRHERLEAERGAALEHAPVEGDAERVRRAVRQHPRPGDREAEGLEAERGQRGEVLLEPVIKDTIE